MEKMKKAETWYVRPDDPVIFPNDLVSNPDKYGGMGMHMACAVHDGVITIPLQNSVGSGGCCVVSIHVVDLDVARRIISDGKVDIYSNGYWSNINSTVLVYHGTRECIPIWGQDVGDSLARLGMIWRLTFGVLSGIFVIS